jgi:hypothetical protein
MGKPRKSRMGTVPIVIFRGLPISHPQGHGELGPPPFPRLCTCLHGTIQNCIASPTEKAPQPQKQQKLPTDVAWGSLLAFSNATRAKTRPWSVRGTPMTLSTLPSEPHYHTRVCGGRVLSRATTLTSGFTLSEAKLARSYGRPVVVYLGPTATVAKRPIPCKSCRCLTPRCLYVADLAALGIPIARNFAKLKAEVAKLLPRGTAE